MTALIVGTILALAALAFVLSPLFNVAPPHPVSAPRVEREPSPSERAIAALREIEFDRETGKLSDADYATLKAEYTRDAIAAMRAQDAAGVEGVEVGDDEVEAAILAYRQSAPVCPTCGPRPEPDAVYCSDCGRFLAGCCAACGTAVTELGARFCTSCGSTLAA